MTKKPAEPLIRFATPSSPQQQATRSLKRVAQSKRKLYVEVPESIHHAVRARALELRKTAAEYILELIEARNEETARIAPFPSAPKQKRLVLDLPAEKAEKISLAGESAGGFRQMVLACLERDGILFPRAIDEQLTLDGVAAGKFVADHFGKVPDEEAARAVWLLHCRMRTRDERYQNDEPSFRSFFSAAKRAAREALKTIDNE